MATREKLHRLVDELSDSEMESVAEFLVSRREGVNVDEWGDLTKFNAFAFGETMRRLAEEERTAGFEPWDRGSSK